MNSLDHMFMRMWDELPNRDALPTTDTFYYGDIVKVKEEPFVFLHGEWKSCEELNKQFQIQDKCASA